MLDAYLMITWVLFSPFLDENVCCRCSFESLIEAILMGNHFIDFMES